MITNSLKARFLWQQLVCFWSSTSQQSFKFNRLENYFFFSTSLFAKYFFFLDNCYISKQHTWIPSLSCVTTWPRYSCHFLLTIFCHLSKNLFFARMKENLAQKVLRGLMRQHTKYFIEHVGERLRYSRYIIISWLSSIVDFNSAYSLDLEYVFPSFTYVIYTVRDIFNGILRKIIVMISRIFIWSIE